MKRQFLAVVLAVFAAAIFLSGAGDAATNTQPQWLSSVAPQVTKEAELTANQEPLATGIDCEPVDIPNGSEVIHSCAYNTPLGRLTDSGHLLDTPRGIVKYDLRSGGKVLPSIPGRPGMILTQSIYYSSQDQPRLGTYYPDKLVYREHFGYPPIKQYEYSGQPGQFFQRIDGGPIAVQAQTLAYSTNGRWAVAHAGRLGLTRLDLDTRRARILSLDIPGFSYNFGHTRMNNFAVSDDGRYIAVTLDETTNTGQKRPALRVYDAGSCRDQFRFYATRATSHACEYKDIWSGEYRTGDSDGIRDALPTAEYPRRVRFVANGTLSFDTIYDRVSTTEYKVARYYVSVPEGADRDYVGLLAMGDSYISGEGAAGKYFSGTDTKNNRCHNAWSSYPYRIGAELFQYGRSVACSGAKMFDVSIEAGDPEGSIVLEERYEGQAEDEVEWGDRETERIINTFSPGYAQQTIFAQEYEPRTVLLSIGGNDIHFADILASCINPFRDDDCYPYYEDRVELMWDILGQYERLVHTYKDVAQKSKGRVYVVGYPQIAKIDGNCGANVKLTSKEIKFGAHLITYLNSVIQRAAGEAGVFYVNTEAALSGHRLCEAPKGQAGMNGLTKGNDGGVGPIRPLGNESYHPTALGHKLLGQMIVSKTQNLTAAMPLPRANNKPALDYSNQLLKNVPKIGRMERALRWTGRSTINLLKKEVQFVVNAPKAALQKASEYKVVIHSEPTVLAEGVVGDGPILFTIPGGIEPGFHTLDIYGTDESGRPVDYREVVYVQEGDDDIDGDGQMNASDSCPAWPQLAVDEDGDGVADDCDAEIFESPVDAPPELAETSPIDFDSLEIAGDPDDTNGLVQEYVPEKPAEQSKDEKSADSGSQHTQEVTQVARGALQPTTTVATNATVLGRSVDSFLGRTSSLLGAASEEQSNADAERLATSDALGLQKSVAGGQESSPGNSSSIGSWVMVAGAIVVTTLLLWLFFRRTGA